MKQLNKCLVCGNEDLKMFCDMGQMPLVNNLKDFQYLEDVKYPLVVNECLVCTHKQLSISIDREVLFNNYLYKTNVSSSHRKFFNDFVNELEGNNVLDIGCNDGSLLWFFNMYEWQTLGIEPCIDLAQECKRKGLSVIRDFFPSKLINDKFYIITAFNVFAHNDDPYIFLIEMAKLLKNNGRIYILTTPARIDNYYHEHISYFTPQSMMVLAKRCGVEVVSFKTVSMHGESYLFEIKKYIDEVIKTPQFSNKQNLVAYGASASEIVLFNLYKLHPEYIIDDNPLKIGKYIPGINSPIYAPDFLKLDKRNLTIIVAHNLFDEITAKIKKMRPKMKDEFVRLI